MSSRMPTSDPHMLSWRNSCTICSVLHRSDAWVRKWWHRYLNADGEDLMFSFQQQLGVGVDKPRRRWLAYQDNEPVAKAFLSLGAGVAGIYGDSTMPAVRRQGIGRAITLTALLAARQLGYRIGVLHSTQMGEGVYRGLGFQEYCRLYLYGLE